MLKLNKLMGKILQTGQGRFRAWMGTLGLGIAALLVLAAVQLQSNFNELLKGKENKDTHAQFLVINRELNSNNLNETALREVELNALKKLPQVAAVGVVQPGYFKASISSNSERFPFYTEVSFESVPNEFLDQIPEKWDWQQTDEYVPVIIPSMYLDVYNFQFALAQQLPQLTPEIVKMVNFTIHIRSSKGEMQLKGRVAGFSDRIQSLLVPDSFMQWCNNRFAVDNKKQPSRVLIKTQDAAAPELSQFLEKNQLTADKEKTRFSKYRQVVNWVAGVSGLSGIFMLGFALLVLTLFIQLQIVRKQAEVKLLIQLGASPEKMNAFLFKKFFPPHAIMVLIAFILIILIQWLLKNRLHENAIELSTFPSWITAVTAGLLLVCIAVVQQFTIRKTVQEHSRN
ncbi:MAG: FtsX-like permease family protein [Sediminibacterium sp.]|nr:FtsX-like permease family protein [Sediminibacterium sp.]